MKTPAIIVDIDGTIAKMVDRGPFEWSKVGSDQPIEPIIDLVYLLSDFYPILFLSGRDEICRPQTEKWLEQNTYIKSYSKLFMRPQGNNEKDSIIKRRIYDTKIKNVYDVRYVLDDRDQVVKMWREELGLTCLQVAYGNF